MINVWFLVDDDLKKSQGRGEWNRIMDHFQGDWIGSHNQLSGKSALMMALESLLGRLSGGGRSLLTYIEDWEKAHL